MLPVSVAVKVKVASLLSTLPDGPLVIVVSGGVVSTVNVALAGVMSVWPLAVARTWKVGCRRSTVETRSGDVQAVKAAPCRYSKVAGVVMLAVKVNVPTTSCRERAGRR